jgi:hypothetical protein
LLFPEADTRNVDDFVSTASNYDFDRIFNRLLSEDEPGNYKQALKEAMLEKFGEETPVYNSSSVSSIPLNIFSDYLIKGIYSTGTTTNVTRTYNNQLFRIDVNFLISQR